MVRQTLHRLFSLSCLMAALSLGANYAARSAAAEVQIPAAGALTEIAKRPPCLRCGNKTAYTPDIPFRPHSIC